MKKVITTILIGISSLFLALVAFVAIGCWALPEEDEEYLDL